MRLGLSLLLLLAACGAPAPVAPDLGPLALREKWIYYPLDLEQPKNVDKLIGLLDRAAKIGFNTVLLEDPNFGHLPLMDAEYFRHLDRIKAAAAERRIDLVPAMFQVGHSENLLAQDPNLAEGVPVRDQLFVVRGGVARVEADPPVAFRPAWDYRDATMSADWVVRNPGGRLARAWQKLRVSPYRQYHVSVRIRTKDFKGTPRIVVLGGGRMLNYNLQGVKATQDWTEHHAVFNSLGDREVRVSIGCWDGETGEAAFADPKIEETGLVNVLRRPGAPLVVLGPDGEPLKEGADFDYVRDRKLGREELPGGYSEWHEPPLIRSGLPDGTRLRISYYHMLRFPDGGQVMICPSEPKTVEILRDQAERLHRIFNAKAYFMSHDEMRVSNWDPSCTKRNMTAGQIFADNVKTCIGILRDLSPSSRIYVWSDMFDPNHNAHDNYYLARGGMHGTWEGLDPDVVVATWFYDKRRESLEWFSSRGHQTLIAGYYDQKPERARDWLEAASALKGTIGIMYTSWYDKYEDLELSPDMPTDSAKRVIVNVATGRYVGLQERLVKSLAKVGWTGSVLTWTNELPPGSPSHETAPYGFKLYAIGEALRRGFTSVLWLDAPCFAAKALGPVFEKIERDGHCFVSGDERLGNWAGDECLAAFGIPRDAAMDMPLLNGAFIGLDLEHARTREWYRRITQQCEAGLFKGAALTEHAPAEVRAANIDKDTGHLSDDPRCWGHRHDEAVGSCLAPLLGMDFTPLGGLFDFRKDLGAIVHFEGA